MKFFLVLRADLTAHIHATRFVNMSLLVVSVGCFPRLKSPRSVTSPSISAISATRAAVIVDATLVRMNHDRFRAGLRFLFFAPGATSGTWRQDAVVLGRKADTTPPRKGPRDLSKNVFVMSTTKLKRNSLPT